MLVLSRKCGERVVVSLNGEVITIEIIKVRGSRVRIGVEAPRHIAVHREEVWNRLATERVDQRMMTIAGQ